MNKRWFRGLAVAGLLAVVVGAHSSASAGTEAPEGGDGAVLAVPADYATIQEAVDAAQPGDLVLVSPGTYHEAVDVVTPEITIRGTDRNEVILDGEFELDNGIRVLGAPGVVVENMTAMNYAFNGFFWTGVDGYRASYLTSYRTGDYGIYAFDSTHGQIEHSYAAGSPDAGVYIGQCYPCDAVIDDVTAEHNGLGYSGTNSGGNLLIVNSRFNNNRAGIVPNSGSYELCYPERETTIVGNLVYSNNQPDTPAIDVAILAMGNGIVIAGGVGNEVSRNRIWDHDKTGIGLVPFLEEGAADDIPPAEDDERPCADTKDDPINTDPPATLIWNSRDNVVTDNVLSDNRTADIGVGVADAPETAADLNNCFGGNELTATAPADLETLAPCDGDGAGDWAAEPLDVVSWLAEAAERPASVPYAEAELPELPELEGMPDAETAPAEPATDMPRAVDLDAIETPPAPDDVSDDSAGDSSDTSAADSAADTVGDTSAASAAGSEAPATTG